MKTHSTAIKQTENMMVPTPLTDSTVVLQCKEERGDKLSTHLSKGFESVLEASEIFTGVADVIEIKGGMYL